MTYVHGKSIIRIAVADDHVMLRETMCAAIDTWEHCKVVVQASDGKELIEKIQQKSQIDLVLLDVGMPVMDGYEVAVWLKKNYPGIKILVISFYNTELTLVKLLKTGVNGFISKSAGVHELKKAVFEVMRTNAYANGDIVKLVASRSKGEEILLSEKELEFVRYLSTDMTYKEIASKLRITERQTDYMRESLFERFEVQSRVGLAMYMSKSGVL